MTKIGIRVKKKRSIFTGLTERVRKERKRRAKGFLPRSTEFRLSVFVGPRTKVYRIDEGNAWVPRKKDFTKDPRKEISRNRSFRV